MTKVILIQPIAAASGSYGVGDEYSCASKDEAQRMIKAGIAKAAPKPREKATRKNAKRETRAS